MNLKSHKTVIQIAKKHGVEPSFILKQLKMGEPIEHEHTQDHDLALDIALQHLEEIPDYYTRLKKMESDAKKHPMKEHCGCEDDAVIELEDKLKSMNDHSYNSIDKQMRIIMKKHGVTAKQLHNAFVSKHDKTPDDWIKNLKEGTLHHWFKGSKSKDGKPGWVQADGSPCANEPGETSTPKCFSSQRLSALKRMGKTGKSIIKSAVRRKRKNDPEQQEKSGASKPTFVKTFAKGKNDPNYIKAEPGIKENMQIQEAEKDRPGRGSGKKDACYHKVKSRYSVWPSAYACVPVKTSKALTRTGWKSYCELKIGEEILTFSLEKNILEFNKIKNIHFYENAQTYYVQNGNTGWKFECTPNHKWVVKYPECCGSRGRKKYRDLINDMRLVSIEDLLNESGSNRKFVLSSTYTGGSPIKLNKIYKYHTNWIEYLLNCSQEQRESWLYSAIVYDGNQIKVQRLTEQTNLTDHEYKFDSPSGKQSFGFKQKDVYHRDAFLLSAFLNSGLVTFKKHKSKDIYSCHYTSYNGTKSLEGFKLKEIKESDVWCPETENGTWVMMQETNGSGIIAITGNSGALTRCRKVGASNWGNKSEGIEYQDMPITSGERYCPKCGKNETQSECKYGPIYWSLYSLPSKLGEAIEKDHEYSMIRSELSTIRNAVKRLQKKVKSGEGDVEAWVQSKITKAADYIDAAADYVDSGEMKEDFKMPPKIDPQLIRKNRRSSNIRTLSKLGSTEGERFAAQSKRNEPKLIKGNITQLRDINAEYEPSLVNKILDELQEEDSCWKGYKRKQGTEKFQKGSCVKKESVTIEDANGNTYAEIVDLITPEPIKGFKSQVKEATRLQAQTGNVIMVILNWRGKYYNLKMFFPQVKLPNRSDIQFELQKVYPGSKVVTHSVSEFAPGQPLIQPGFQGGSFGKPGPSKNYVKTMGEDFEIDEDWQSINRKDKTDGLSKKAVNAYRRENPGSKLKTAVTEKNPGGKRAKRRKSFCSRSAGQRDMHNIDCSKTPDKPICKARRRWRCR